MTAYDNRFTKLEHDIALLRWMIAGVYALLLPIFFKLFLGGTR